MSSNDEIVHEVPMRWADLDSLNHVNNVVYLDYAAESRSILIDDGVLPRGPIAHMAVDYVRPLLLSRHPVSVVSTIHGGSVQQEICSDVDGVRTVFARVTSTYGSPQTIQQHTPVREPLPTRLRRSDLDVAGGVTATKMFELFQEGRILFLSTRLSGMSPGRFVVAAVEVAFGQPIGWREEPYQSRSWVSRIGESSVTVQSELSDGAVVAGRATSILVGFDLPTQKSRKLSATEKAEFGAID